jgi:exo-beta-1,3-glucanase (GH17 family)
MLRSSAARPLLLKGVTAFLSALSLSAVGAAASSAQPAYQGAQVHSLWSSVTSAQASQELDALQGAGANALRVDVGWATMEPTSGYQDPTYLAKLDALVAGAQARGIKIIATLWQTPPWASAAGNWNDAPSDASTYGRFARFITHRYGSELAAVEAWNEPEINNNLLASNLPATYAQMIRSFYTGAKEGNASVAVLAGSLAYADIPFLKALYANGIKGYYDGISVHPYADGADPANTSVTHSFLGGIQALHAAQQASGDNTQMWVTEFGWPTGTSRGASGEQQQAEYVERAFRILAGVPYVQGATVYQLRDMATDPSNPEDNFGLLRQDFTPRPAYASFKAALSGSAVALIPVGSTQTQPVTSLPRRRARAARRSPLTLTLHKRRNALIAQISVNRQGVVKLGVVCTVARRVTSVRRLTVRLSARRRFRHKMGVVSRLRGCQVYAGMVGSRMERARVS